MTLKEKLDNIPVNSNLFSGLSKEDIKYEKFMGKISGRLILERTKGHMSQEELAQKLGVKQSLISKWESGDNNFTFHQVIKIFGKLGIDVDITFKPQNEYIVDNISSFKLTKFPKQKTMFPVKDIKKLLSEFSNNIEEKSAIA